ncbi:MAG: thioredoxin [Ruminococcaceae bacterium]|nr:thioredoxin [Oscillospiraceae bacterium]
MSVLVLNSENFHKEVIESNRPVLIDFWASWCPPCRMLSPIIEEIADAHPEIKVCKVNVEEAEDLAKEFNIMSIPTMLVFKDGKVVNKAVGVKPMRQILELIEM